MNPNFMERGGSQTNASLASQHTSIEKPFGHGHTGQNPIGNGKPLRVRGLIADVNNSMATIKNTIMDKGVYQKRSFLFNYFHRSVLVNYSLSNSNHLH
jgi:hypothetical protein